MKNHIVIVSGANSMGVFSRVYFNVSEDEANRRFEERYKRPGTSQVVEFVDELALGVDPTNRPHLTAD